MKMLLETKYGLQLMHSTLALTSLLMNAQSIHPISVIFSITAKKLGRDKLLTVLINLHYDFDATQAMLQRLHMPMLYVRNKRDYVIAVCIHEGKTLDEIEDILQSKGMELLMRPLVENRRS